MKDPVVHLTRRSLTKLGAATPLLMYERNLPTPDFHYDAMNPPFRAGIRPYREQTFRIEAEMHGDRLLVHNYGHGGAGITMSWGSALEVQDIVRAHVASHGVRPVAVLGSGAIGLTAATTLAELGLPVTVYAKGFFRETTSAVAGGQFAPSTVAFDDSDTGTARYKNLLRRSFRAHEARIGQGFGVERRPNFALSRSRSLEAIPRDCVPEPQHFTQAPFDGHEGLEAWCYDTLLVEPPIFLAKLEADLLARGTPFVRRAFTDLADVLTLEEPILVNAMGLGAGAVFQDPLIVPIRGQLVVLPPQSALRYLYVSQAGYIFPRTDGVVVGGSFERGVSDPTPVPAMCRTIIETVRAAFMGDRETVARAPAWLLDDD